MTISVDAVYREGVLKPATPLPLQENQTVRISVETPNGNPTDTVDAITARLRRLVRGAKLSEALKAYRAQERARG